MDTQSSAPDSGSASKPGLPSNLSAALCYVCFFITGLIFLAVEKEEKEVRYHAWQAIFFGVAVFLLQVVIWILVALFSSLTAILGGFIGVLGSILNLGVVVLWVICMVKAYRLEHFKLPVIGDLAEAQS